MNLNPLPSGNKSTDFKKFNYNHSEAAMILPLRLFYFKFVPQLQADLFIVRPVSWNLQLK
ncbi:MAG: hypothetical protein C5B52_05440 [Bacteroidetes bacterium]|nr:MAG: hypothetical protein C5B52_05440 [Bacteroidota bacterium]